MSLSLRQGKILSLPPSANREGLKPQSPQETQSYKNISKALRGRLAPVMFLKENSNIQ